MDYGITPVKPEHGWLMELGLFMHIPDDYHLLDAGRGQMRIKNGARSLSSKKFGLAGKQD